MERMTSVVHAVPPAVERILREAYLMPAVTLSPENMFRCPGCDCEPVGYAPHNGQGDCPPKGADRTAGLVGEA